MDYNDTTYSAPSTSTPGISLAMIVKDGGKFLAPLLEEAKHWVDEIIIGDTGSLDGSQKIALAAGASVFDIPWQDDFSTARNEVLAHCSQYWVLCLDVDELISPQDWKILIEFAHDPRNLQHPMAISLLTRNYLASGVYKRGKTIVPHPDPHQLSEQAISTCFVPNNRVRLFPKRTHIEFRGILNETVESSLKEACIPIVPLPVVIHNKGTLVEKAHKNQFYFKLALAQTRHQPHDALAWSQLACSAINCGDMSEALAAIDRALILNPGHAGNRLTLGSLLKESGQLDTADMQLAAVAGLGGVSDSELAAASHLRAQIAMVGRRTKDVTALLGIALRLEPENGFFQNTLGVWLLSQGKTNESLRALEIAQKSLPLEIDPPLNLGLLFEEIGEPQKALHYLQLAFGMDENNAKLNAAIGRVTMMLEQEAIDKRKPCPAS